MGVLQPRDEICPWIVKLKWSQHQVLLGDNSYLFEQPLRREQLPLQLQSSLTL